MGVFDRQTAPEALIDLLDRERLAVREGRFDLLERLVHEKTRLIAVVAQGGVNEDLLRRLKRSSERNAKLLAAMQSGINAAMRRVEAIRTGPAPLRTYTAMGQHQDLGAARPNTKHRA